MHTRRAAWCSRGVLVQLLSREEDMSLPDLLVQTAQTRKMSSSGARWRCSPVFLRCLRFCTRTYHGSLYEMAGLMRVGRETEALAGLGVFVARFLTGAGGLRIVGPGLLRGGAGCLVGVDTPMGVCFCLGLPLPCCVLRGDALVGDVLSRPKSVSYCACESGSQKYWNVNRRSGM